MVYLVTVISVLLLILSLPFIDVQVSTQSRGIIRSSREQSQIQVIVSGEVVRINIEENVEVSEGDTLFVINYANIEEKIRREQKRIEEKQQFISDINKLLNDNIDIESEKYRTEWNYYIASLFENQTKIDFYEKEVLAQNELCQKNIISEQELLRYKTNYNNAVNQKENIKKQFFNRWQSEQTSYELEIRDIKSLINQLTEERNKYIVIAPCSGSIMQFSGIKEGSFIAAGQTIAYISPQTDLLVECYVSPLDIGYIEIGQNVLFQLDAFNYNQWGLAHGSVQDISKDVVLLNDQSAFKVRCKLDDNYLSLKNGYKVYLQKGMTLTGRFYLTDRSLWQLLFDKMEDWLNPKIKGE